MDPVDEKNGESGSFTVLCAKTFGTRLDQHNQLIFVRWAMLWAIALIATTWLLKAGYVGAPISWLLAIVPSLIGLFALLSYLRFLRQADELVRKIELEGLAIGFGAGVLFLMAYLNLEQLGLPALGHKSGAVMLFAWVFGQLLARRRYL